MDNNRISLISSINRHVTLTFLTSSPETLLLCLSRQSWFYDAPASTLGLRQADDLSKFLKSKKKTRDETEMKHLKILNADPSSPPSKMLCSNLRRAVSTLAAGFKERLSRRYV